MSPPVNEGSQEIKLSVSGSQSGFCCPESYENSAGVAVGEKQRILGTRGTTLVLASSRGGGPELSTTCRNDIRVRVLVSTFGF